ncbi:UNVERIFIED_CONTAM: hypothetical protein Sangu_0244500 [Sesamum angustifolium]|uniref:RNase H type-1 domain-containing protein n=1 Tax=Sesamum angustifolium TaxID=2727405 RepID=A0AAW2RPD2_9LAMI
MAINCRGSEDQGQIARKANLQNDWRPPPRHWLKINCKAAFFEGEASCAWILSSQSGNILQAATFSTWTDDATQAEAEVILQASLSGFYGSLAKHLGK